jgi:hypothetical protein
MEKEVCGGQDPNWAVEPYDDDVPPKLWLLPASPHGVAIQKTNSITTRVYRGRSYSTGKHPLSDSA